MNKHISYITRILSVAAILSAGLLAGSCAHEDTPSAAKPEGTEVTFSLEVPGARLPETSTRGMITNGGEDEVREIDLILFDAATSRFVERVAVAGSSISQEDEVVTFKARMSTRGTSTIIVMVANSRNLFETTLSWLTEGVPKRDFIGSLIDVSQGTGPDSWKWNANNTGYRPIPMYGETTVSAIAPTMAEISGITLTRMLARIDIQNSDPDFELARIYLANHYTAGFVSSPFDETGGVITPRPEHPYIPIPPAEEGTTYQQLGGSNAISYAYTPTGGIMAGEIYTYEAPQPVDDANRQNATCLVLEGKLNGQTYFYRVDFTTDNATDPSSVDYVALLRNYKYIVNIEKVVGTGYSSVDEAIASYTMVSNLKTKVISYDYSKLTSTVFNGQYMLGVERDKVSFTLSTATEYINVPVFTDAVGGWSAVIESGADWVQFATWDNNGENNSSTTSGPANNHNLYNASRMSLKAQPYTAATTTQRTARIKVTASNGRLALYVDATQTSGVAETLSVVILDANGNELPRSPVDATRYVMQFGLHAGEESVPSQRIYVKTTHAQGYHAFFDPPSWLNGALLIEYSPNSTPIVQNRESQSFGDGYWYGGDNFKSFDIEPLPRAASESSNEYWDLLRFVTLDKDQGWGKTETPLIQIYQGDWIKLIDLIDAGQHLLGNVEYTFTARATTPWKIIKIEEIYGEGPEFNGTTGNLLTVSTAANYLQEALTGGVGAVGGAPVNTAIKFNTARWVKGRKGKIAITFRSTAANSPYPDATFTLDVFEGHLDYTKSSAKTPFFYIFPIHVPQAGGGLGWANTSSIPSTWAVHNARCAAIGDNWRLPTVSELTMAIAYSDALTYQGAGSKGDAPWYYTNYWTLSSVGSNMSTIMVPQGYGSDLAPGESVMGRCVYTPGIPAPIVPGSPNIPNQPAAGKHYYPYVISGTGGPIIVSRDADGGVEAGVLGTPAVNSNGIGEDGNPQHNRVAPKLQVALADAGEYAGQNRNEAIAICNELGNGWRLPSIKEMTLIWTVGGSNYPVTYYQRTNDFNLGVPMNEIQSGFTLISADQSYWTSSYAKPEGVEETVPGTLKAWSFAPNSGWGNSVPSSSEGVIDGVSYGGVRCVRTYTE